jgi:hypothetical protein
MKNKPLIGTIFRTVLILTPALYFFCDHTQPNAPIVNQPVVAVSPGDTLTLTWDPPKGSPAGASIERYELFYRQHAATDSGWTFLSGSVGAVAQPSRVVIKTEIGSGLFDFAVRSVFSNGEKSDFLTNLESSVYYRGGWYLSW